MPLKGYKAHKTLHQDGGSDEVSVAALSGELADRQPSKTGSSVLGWTDEKLLKGAGAGNAPEEIDVPAGGGPTIVRKTADEIVNNSAVLQNDDHLFFAVAANEVWAVQLVVHLLQGASATAYFKYAFTVPNGASIAYGGYYNPASIVNQALIGRGTATAGVAIPDYDVPAGAVKIIPIWVIIANGATAGNVQFQWAQATAVAIPTTVKTNSCLIAHKLA